MKTSLKKAVLAQIGITQKEFKNCASDYRNAQNGISGFVYYSDTHKFSLQNQSDILELLDEMADNMGEDVVEMVNSFGVFRPNGMKKDEKTDLYKFLVGNKNESDYETNSVLNVMAWLCVEELANEFDN